MNIHYEIIMRVALPVMVLMRSLLCPWQCSFNPETRIPRSLLRG